MNELHNKFSKLLLQIDTYDRDTIKLLSHELQQDESFIKYCVNKYDWTPEEHDGLLKVVELDKNNNGYFVDKYNQRISYNGIRTLKRANTEIDLNEIQQAEYDKCKADFKYFRQYYCFITTKTGLARPEPRHYQEELEDELLTLEDLVILYPRQSGKTVTAATYLLWRSMFHGTKLEIGIVANKPKTAREVLDKMKKIFMLIPVWMMPGIEVWNKSEIEYENGTRVMTDSPSSDSFRGYTCNIIYTDESAYIKKSLWDDFIDAVMPTMNSLIFKQVINTSTANGMNHFYSLVQGAKPINSEVQTQTIIDEIEIGGDGLVISAEELYKRFEKIKHRRELQAKIQWEHKDV